MPLSMEMSLRAFSLSILKISIEDINIKDIIIHASRYKKHQLILKLKLCIKSLLGILRKMT